MGKLMIKKRLAGLASLLIAPAILLAGQVGAAGSATITLSSSGSSFAKDSQFTVTVRENSGSVDVYALQINVSYDSSKLQYVSSTVNTGVFTQVVQNTGSGGTVRIGAGAPGVTGNQKVADIRFKVLSSSGSANISVASGTVLVGGDNDEDIWNGNPHSISVATTAPASSGGNSGGSGGSTDNTSKPSGSSNTSNNKPKATSDQNPKIELVAADDDPVEVESENNAQGYIVAVTILDKDGKAVAGAEVSLDDQTVKSDDSGIASFMNVPAGGHTLKSGDVSKIIYVEADDNYAKVQEFSLEIKASGFNWVRAAIVVFSVTALAVIALFFSAKSKIDGSAASGGGISGGSSSGDAKPVTSSLSVAPEPKVISPGAQNTN